MQAGGEVWRRGLRRGLGGVGHRARAKGIELLPIQIQSEGGSVVEEVGSGLGFDGWSGGLRGVGGGRLGRPVRAAEASWAIWPGGGSFNLFFCLLFCLIISFFSLFFFSTLFS